MENKNMYLLLEENRQLKVLVPVIILLLCFPVHRQYSFSEIMRHCDSYFQTSHVVSSCIERGSRCS